MTDKELREEIALMRRTQPANAVSVKISLEFMNALFDAVDKLDAVPVEAIRESVNGPDVSCDYKNAVNDWLEMQVLP